MVVGASPKRYSQGSNPWQLAMAKPDRNLGIRAPSCCHKHHTRFKKRRFHRAVRRACKALALVLYNPYRVV